MINDVRDTFISSIDHLDWMDTNTKTYAKEKVLKPQLVETVPCISNFCA